MLSFLGCPLTTSSRKNRVLPGNSRPRHKTNKQTKNTGVIKGGKTHKRCAGHTYGPVNSPFFFHQEKNQCELPAGKALTRGRLTTAEEGREGHSLPKGTPAWKAAGGSLEI